MGRSEESEEEKYTAPKILRPAEDKNMGGTQNDDDQKIAKRKRIIIR
jgi:hypothetical protein